MSRSEGRLQQIFARELPWGPLFARRANFESGYLQEEGRLVAKYLKPKSDVLVLGSGNGREARPISQDGHRIVCADVGFLYLVSGRGLLSGEGVRGVAFLQADAAHLPFRQACFDFVFFSFYSSQAEKRFEVLSGIGKCLKAGGLILLTACTPRYLEMYRESPLNTDGWAFVSSAEQLCAEVSTCGFELLDGALDPGRPEYRCALLRRGT
jgi:SAM-dependent methyltransferase